MKKKILFVIPDLSSGGGEKSLINLLSQFNFDLYDVDLFLFNKSGLFINLLPEKVNVLDFPYRYKIFTYRLLKSICYCIKGGHVQLASSRLIFTIKNRLSKDKTIAEQYTWKYISKALVVLDKEYDVAIGYLEKSPIYFVVDKVKSKKKIGWIHTNYSNSGMDSKFDNPYFRKLDYIVTVSEECEKSLIDKFYHLKAKIRLIHNIVSPKIVKDFSNEKIEDGFTFEKDCINIVTLARLSYEKGIDIAIKSCRLLIDRGYKIKWYVLGQGPEKYKLQHLIKSNELNQCFILLGVKENPYPYIKQADIYVQPSRYEGKSIAIDEAKVLNKPIVVTNFQTARDQINNEINGLIVGVNEKSLSHGIEGLIKNPSFRNALIYNLSQENLGTEGEINKLYEIIGR